jgi:signal transduction histidine kinase
MGESGGAIDTHRVYARALAEANRAFEEKVRELSALRRASDALLEAVDLTGILKSALDIVFDEINPINCSIMLLDRAGERLLLRAARGADDDEGVSFTEADTPRAVDKSFGAAGLALSAGTPVLVVDAGTDPVFKELPGGVSIGSLLVAPLIYGRKPLGVVNMSSPEPSHFSPENERLVTILSGLVSTAVENAQLVDRLVAKERLSSLGKMAAAMIHDMRTPMHVIAGFAELIAEEGTAPGERREYLGIINTQLERFMSLAEETLEFSRGEEATLEKKPITFEALAREMETTLKDSYAKKRVALACRVEEPLSVAVDQTKLLRALFNLTNNACDAMEDNGGVIGVIFGRGPEGARITVNDNGKGIPAAALTQIFEPFVSVNKSNGTGLGLPITRRIVEAHGGRLRVVSTEGKGTTFTLDLPLP